jgi:AraC family transcriptional activator of pobA
MDGEGEVCIDFQDYQIKGPTLVFTSPGQVHRWSRTRGLVGPFKSFTQEFYDGRESPPTSLLEHDFWYPFQTPPVLPLRRKEAASIQFFWKQLELEVPLSKERNEAD